MFSSEVSVAKVFGTPMSINPSGLMMGVDRNHSQLTSRLLKDGKSFKIQHWECIRFWCVSRGVNPTDPSRTSPPNVV